MLPRIADFAASPIVNAPFCEFTIGDSFGDSTKMRKDATVFWTKRVTDAWFWPEKVEHKHTLRALYVSQRTYPSLTFLWDLALCAQVELCPVNIFRFTAQQLVAHFMPLVLTDQRLRIFICGISFCRIYLINMIIFNIVKNAVKYEILVWSDSTEYDIIHQLIDSTYCSTIYSFFHPIFTS